MTANELATIAQQTPSPAACEDLWCMLLPFTRRLCRYDEDNVQECYFALLAALKSWKPDAGESFFAWYRRYAINHLVRLKHPQEVLTVDAPVSDEDGDTLGALLEDESSVEAFASSMLRADVGNAVEALPVNMQQVVRWSYWGELPLRIQADRLHCSAERVRQLRREALRLLQRDERIIAHQPLVMDEPRSVEDRVIRADMAAHLHDE